MTLADLHTGDRATIVQIAGEPAVVQRLYEFGLLEGETLELLGRAPLGDPLEIRLGSSRFSLRRVDALGITVAIS